VRSQHEKDHVVDNVGVRQKRPVVPGGAAQMRKQIFAAALATERNLPVEILDQLGAAPHAAAHGRAGQRHANDRDRGCQHGYERLLDRFQLGTKFPAKERCRRQVERQLFDQKVKLDFRSARPLRDAARNTGIELG
jgi:hypothetical protein